MAETFSISSDSNGIVIPGTNSEELGKLEDTAHVSGSVGVAALGVRGLTASADTNFDYALPFLQSRPVTGESSLRPRPTITEDFGPVASGTEGMKKYYTVNSENSVFTDLDLDHSFVSLDFSGRVKVVDYFLL